MAGRKVCGRRLRPNATASLGLRLRLESKVQQIQQKAASGVALGHTANTANPTRVALELFNTLSGKIEPLFASDGAALRMYCCGPTVYDYGHIGNFRTFLHVDVLRRVIRMHGIETRHVMNITDVDDKIIRNAAAAGQPIGEYTAKFTEAFFEDSEALGIQTPEAIARATENIDDMVRLI